jgi:hypothetical protein
MESLRERFPVITGGQRQPHDWHRVTTSEGGILYLTNCTIVGIPANGYGMSVGNGGARCGYCHDLLPSLADENRKYCVFTPSGCVFASLDRPVHMCATIEPADRIDAMRTIAGLVQDGRLLNDVSHGRVGAFEGENADV